MCVCVCVCGWVCVLVRMCMCVLHTSPYFDLICQFRGNKDSDEMDTLSTHDYTTVTHLIPGNTRTVLVVFLWIDQVCDEFSWTLSALS